MSVMETLSIRRATRADAADLLILIRELAEFVHLSDEVQTDEATLRENLFSPSSTAEAWLATLDGQPVGYAVTFPIFSTFLGRSGLYLEDLFVRSGFRHRGYGRALLEHLARDATRRGCPRLDWNVLAWNAAAIRFYESLGAIILPDNRVCRLSGPALQRFGG